MESDALGSVPRVARLAGVIQLLEGLASGGQVGIVPALVVTGDATATASKILGNEGLYRAAATLSLVDVVLHLAWGLALYVLLRVVHRTVALFSLLLLVVGCALQALSAFLLLPPLAVLSGGSALSAFSAVQQDALAYLALRWNTYAYDVYLAFFGFWLISIGYLIYGSGFLPRIIGALLVLDGCGWSLFASPPLGAALFPVILAGSGLGELPLIVWLLVRGVDANRWRARAAAVERVPAT